jgi:hypothetical protein
MFIRAEVDGSLAELASSAPTNFKCIHKIGRRDRPNRRSYYVKKSTTSQKRRDATFFKRFFFQIGKLNLLAFYLLLLWEVDGGKTPL